MSQRSLNERSSNGGARLLNDQIEGLYDELIRLQIEHDWKAATEVQKEIRRLERKEGTDSLATDQTSVWFR